MTGSGGKYYTKLTAAWLRDMVDPDIKNQFGF